MVVGASRRDIFKIGVCRHTSDAMVTTDVGVCTMRSPVRKRTTKNSNIGRNMEWVGVVDRGSLMNKRGWVLVLNLGDCQDL